MSQRSNSFVYDIWRHSFHLPGTQLTLRGHSRGSEKSCFYIQELKMFLDAGIEAYYNPDFIFITHCHSDHSFALPMILTGLDRKGKHPPRTFAPQESHHLFQNFLEVTYQLRKGTIKARGHYRVTGVSPGQEVDLKKDGYFVRIYDLHHNVPTRGYGICQRRKKLNPIYQGLSGKDLGALKKNGVDISIYPEYKLLGYVLDTNISCFKTNPELLNYSYIIVECTFFKEDHSSDHHIHWNDLKPIVHQNKDVMFILIHFSMQYTWEEIAEFFEEERKTLKNIIVWMN